MHPLLATSGFHAEDAILIVVIAALLAASGVLAMAETSLVRMNRIKAKSLVDEKKRGARQLARLVENPANFLNPILLLVLICQLVSATLVGIVAEHLLGGLGVLFGIVFEIVVIFVFFEAVPKNWAVQHADRAALLSAPFVSTLIRFPPIRWLSAVLIGLANLIIGSGGDEEGMPRSYITDSELKAMADVAHEEKVIEHDERTFIHSIIDFGDTVTREVMTPRPDMVTVEGDVTVRDALEAALGADTAASRWRRKGSTTSSASPTPRTWSAPSGWARPRSPCVTACGRPSSSPNPRRSLISCARCRRRSSTWRSSSTSTAAPRD